MHKVSIPQAVIDDVVRNRGREHVFDTLDPAKTALIVVDLQNGFMLKGVAHALCEEAIEIVPNVNRLAQAVRRTGGTVVWVQNAATPESMQSWSVRDDMDGPERTARRVAAMAPGTKGYELWDGLDVKLNDLRIEKTRFSAFIQGASNLEAVLRARGIDTVIITGTVTNVCCEATARDAMMRNFKTIMVTDANAAENDALHTASLIAFYLKFGDIMPTDMVIASLTANATRASAAE
jgi:ureidoacrylate peracid hydrolase